MVKVSIIMPVYNDEEYLDKSINSVINQSLKDIELICIDDGSTDNSLKILKDLERKYNFIKIISQENKGAGKARNAGLKIAKGEYIAFLDSDDIFIDSTALEEMYNYGIEEDAIMISANLKALNNGELIDHHIYKSKRCSYFSEKKLVKSDDYGIPWYFYKNMFKRSFLVENNIYFPDLRRGQDPIFLVKTLANIKEFAAVPIYLYGYNVSSGGGAGNKVNTYRKKLDYITHFKKTFDILEEADYTNILSIYKKSLFQYLSSYDNEKDKDYYDIVNDTFGGIEYFKEEFEEEYYLFLLNQLLNQINDSNFKDIKEKVENLKIENYEFIPSDLFIFYKNILYSETFQEYNHINKLKKEHDELLLKNKKLRKINIKLNKKLKKLNKINKEIISSNSWKITKPLRIIGSLRGKNMTFTEKILQHSNSYNFYKGGYKKLTKTEKKNKEEIKKLKKQLKNKDKQLKNKDKQLKNKDKQLKNKEKEYNDLKILNSELKNDLNQINNSLNSLTQNFNQYKNIDYVNSLFSKEVRYALVFKDTIEGCEWLTNTTFSLNNSASNYSFMYTLFRILDEINPQNILELGLGQTTKLTTQYANFFKDSKLITVDGDQDWIDVFSEKLTCEGNINIIQQDTEKFTYNETENLRYKDLSNIVKEDKFDLIIIDGPNGFFPETGELLTYSRSNIWNLLDNNLAEDFVIIIDDYERLGEKNTMNKVEELLNEKDIEFYTFKSFGLKEQYVICSEKYKFVSWF